MSTSNMRYSTRPLSRKEAQAKHACIESNEAKDQKVLIFLQP